MAQKRVCRPKPPKEKPAAIVVGPCPECDREVIVYGNKYVCTGELIKTKNFDEYIANVCHFGLYRDRLKALGKAEITPEEMGELLKGRAIILENMRRNDGRLFSCDGVLEFMDGRWGIKFVRGLRTSSTPIRNGSPLRRKVPLAITQSNGV